LLTRTAVTAALLTWSLVKHKKIIIHVFVDLHDCCVVSTSICVVGCTEYCNKRFVVGPIITSHDNLMSARNKHKPVFMIELLGHISAEYISCSSLWNTPARPRVIGLGRVRPK
jgi:hypothetical protein